jgi:hypothetical protein
MSKKGNDEFSPINSHAKGLEQCACSVMVKWVPPTTWQLHVHIYVSPSLTVTNNTIRLSSRACQVGYHAVDLAGLAQTCSRRPVASNQPHERLGGACVKMLLLSPDQISLLHLLLLPSLHSADNPVLKTCTWLNGGGAPVHMQVTREAADCSGQRGCHVYVLRPT